jgi:hypothetical protein
VNLVARKLSRGSDKRAPTRSVLVADAWYAPRTRVMEASGCEVWKAQLKDRTRTGAGLTSSGHVSAVKPHKLLLLVALRLVTVRGGITVCGVILFEWSKRGTVPCVKSGRYGRPG